MSIETIKKKCFFCSLEIKEKKSLEHIIPNSLLRKLNLKQEFLYGSVNETYSRVKVPAHQHCNNSFGSQYEDKVLKLLDFPDKIYDTVREDSSIYLRYGPDNNDVSILRTWMTKIFYGLFYKDLFKTADVKYQDTCLKMINSYNFFLTQESYKYGHGFNIPSSLYAFKTSSKTFNLRTLVTPETLMMQLNGVILILCIGDGFLLKNYLKGATLNNLIELLAENDELEKFPTALFALAEITALRLNIPKSPKFLISNGTIFNLSFNTLAISPDLKYHIDEEKTVGDRMAILKELGVTII